jgi:CheY-like chemotaxis protein
VETVCAQILALLEQDDNSRLVIDSLTRSGHDVVRSKNFNDAISVLQNKKVAIIISDVHLENGGNVFDFLTWVTRNPLTCKTPFVLLSYRPTPLAKHLEDGVRTTARLLGAASYISTDSFNSGEFRKHIDKLLQASDQSGTETEKSGLDTVKEW